MLELAERISKLYDIDKVQAIMIIRILQDPNTIQENFWLAMREVVEKRLKNEPIL